MSSQKTEHYELNQWLATDQVLRTDFNADNAKIDNALGTLASAVAQCGNCKIIIGSYTGAGKYGGTNKNTLTFSGQPLLIIIVDEWIGTIGTFIQGAPRALFLYDHEDRHEMDLVWSGNSVSWDSSSTIDQMNESGRMYRYVAFMAADV